MVKKNSGRGQMTKRDERILRDLYRTLVLSIEQVQLMHFRSYARARRRLYDLREMGKVQNTTIQANETPYGESRNVWMLTPDGLRYVLNDLKKEGPERTPRFPAHRNIFHYLDTNDVYAMVSGELVAALGEYATWEWLDERRAFRSWNMGGEDGKHRPDAEVRFGGNVYCVERETERARESPAHFVERMKGYAGYIRYARANGSAEGYEVMWACDTGRDEKLAVEAGQRFGVATYAGTPNEVFERLARYAWNEARRHGPAA